MSAMKLTGSALSQALAKAAQAAIGRGLQANADRFSRALDEGRAIPSPPSRGRAGEEGAFAPSPENPDAAQAVSLPQGGREKAEPRLAIEKSGSGSLSITLAAPALFAREFGGFDSAADPVVAPAIARIKGRLA